MLNTQAMEKDYSVQFFSTFIANLQKLCQAYIKFDRNIEVSGYVCVEIDNSKKERYVLSELVQNCGSVVSESYCTKVFRTLPPLAPTSQKSASQIDQDSWSVNTPADKPRHKVSQERRGSISSNKSIESLTDIRESENGSVSNYSSDGAENLRVSSGQRSKRTSFDQDKENSIRMSWDAAQRLSQEIQSRTCSESSRSWHQVQRRDSLPSFAHISNRGRSSSSTSLASPSETVLDLESVKVEGSGTRQSCVQAKHQPSSPIEHGEGFGGVVPVGIHANLSNLGHIVEAFAASRSAIAQPAHSSEDRFSRPSVSVSQASHSPAVHSQVPTDISSGRSRGPSLAASRSQQEVFMQMLPQGYGQSSSRHSVQMVQAADRQHKLEASLGDCPEDVIDLDIDDMDTDHTDSSIADVNASLTLSGIDQSVLSEYMTSSVQVTDIQRKRNAQLNCQRYALRLFCEFHQSKSGSMSSLDTIPQEQLDVMLSDFYATSKKGNGEDFTVSSLRSIQYYLESHLFENFILSGSRAVVFKNSRQALRKRCEELRVKQKSSPINKRNMTSSDIDLLFEKGQLGAATPDVLLNTLWLMNVMCFGIKGSEHFSLRWGDIILNTDKEGRQFLEYAGSGTSGQPIHCLRVYSLPHNQSRCCVHFFKQYLSHRPAIALQPDDPFYLAINNQYERVGSWYVKEKLSMSRLSSTWRNILFAAGLPSERKPPVGYQTGLFLQAAQIPVPLSRHMDRTAPEGAAAASK
ncbi:uncharacterized protein LOC124111704 [Haliotis rufescens]|uniref:uncharacterized protein LOC124111704 n=1 Tax=Haliotis rufescens TaxID=6454 RepID=UPI001EB06BED|nr:uncharacterized protein LOC124111704 [Haliotis rufescens]